MLAVPERTATLSTKAPITRVDNAWEGGVLSLRIVLKAPRNVCFRFASDSPTMTKLGRKAASHFAAISWSRFRSKCPRCFPGGRCWPKENDDGYFTI
jgi:hypothetical protein